MTELFPQFKEFLESEVLSNDYDYIIPIETKGALVMKEVISEIDKPRPKILYRRAFDFLHPSEMKGKKAAIIDDAVFTGKTINNVAKELLDKGLNEIKKFAFILYESDEVKQHRQIEGLSFSTLMEKHQFENIIEELSNLYLKFRPSNPDHLLFSAYLPEPALGDALFELSKYSGFTVEYNRDPSIKSWSVHYPIWSPALDETISKDACSNKIRFNIERNGYVIKFSSQFFPSLFVNSNLKISDKLWREINKILSRPWNDKTTKTRNLYESFSISKRMKQTKNLIRDIGEYGISLENLHLEKSRLEQYFGEKIASQLLDIWSSYLESDILDEGIRSTVSFDYEYPLDIFGLTKELMEVLHFEYIKENESEKNPYLWKSVGRDIEELAQKTGRSKPEVAIGIEIMNDYGYCSPMFDVRKKNSQLEAKRSYRLSEAGTFRLNL